MKHLFSLLIIIIFITCGFAYAESPRGAIVTFHEFIPIYSDSINSDTLLVLFQEREDITSEWIDSFYDVKLLEKSQNRFKVVVCNWMHVPLECCNDAIGWIDKKHVGRYEMGYYNEWDQYYDIIYDEPNVMSKRNYVFFRPTTPFFIEDWENGFYKVKYHCDSLMIEGWLNRFEPIF